MHYTIYQITNTIDNKIYIGMHQTDNLDDDYKSRIFNSNIPLYTSTAAFEGSE